LISQLIQGFLILPEGFGPHRQDLPVQRAQSCITSGQVLRAATGFM